MFVFCYSAVRHDFLKLCSRHPVRLLLLQTLPRASGVLCHLTHEPKFCRDVASDLKIYIFLALTCHWVLPMSQFARALTRWWRQTFAGQVPCLLGEESVLCRQRDNNAVGGRTFRLLPSLRPGFKDKQTDVQGTKLLQRRGRRWFAVYTTNQPPPPSSRVTPPKICWKLEASSLFLKEFHFPKFESLSPGWSWKYIPSHLQELQKKTHGVIEGWNSVCSVEGERKPLCVEQQQAWLQPAVSNWRWV